MTQSSVQAPEGSTYPSSPIDKDHRPALPANRSPPAGCWGAALHRERATTSEGLEEESVFVWVGAAAGGCGG